jgi:uncharacterized protein (DUF488 family)
MSVYTIGHSNHEERVFLGLLVEHGIELLVDVRSAPYSRYSPHFNRESIGHALSSAGINYAFAGNHLGGRPKDPSCYRNGVIPPPQADYLKLVDYPTVATKPWYLQAIEQLIQLADEQRVAVMCSEEDPQQCHRHHLIAQTLLERGIEVVHIRKSGHSELAESLAEDAPGMVQASLPM